MGLGDLAKKAKRALDSDKGEKVSDQVLDRGAALADRATGGKYADKIDQGRDAVDERVGTEGSAADRAPGDASGRPPGRRRADTEVDAGGTGDPSGKHRA